MITILYTCIKQKTKSQFLYCYTTVCCLTCQANEPARLSLYLIQTTVFKIYGVDMLFVFNTYPWTTSYLPTCMKPSNLSLECPREVANVSSSYEESTVWSQKANLHRHVSRHLTLKNNWVMGQKRKAAPMHFVLSGLFNNLGE